MVTVKQREAELIRYINLKLAALNAIACASELGRLRPQGKVQ